MTSQDQPGQPSQDNRDPLEETRQFSDTPPRSRYKSGWLWIGLSVAVLAGVTAALVSIATGGGTHQAASSSSLVAGASSGTTGPSGGGTTPQGTSTAKGASTANGAGTAKGTSTTNGAGTPQGTSTTKGQVISAADLAEKGGALGLPTSMKSGVASWQSGPGGRDLNAVSSRLGQALQASGIRQYTSMKFACTQLASSVATAGSGPQIPDAAMRELYTKALTGLAKGAADCQTAISIKAAGDETTQTHVDTTMLHQATSELSAGATDVFRSTAEIQIASRQQH